MIFIIVTAELRPRFFMPLMPLISPFSPLMMPPMLRFSHAAHFAFAASLRVYVIFDAAFASAATLDFRCLARAAFLHYVIICRCY